jgi:hypothetical protein
LVIKENDKKGSKKITRKTDKGGSSPAPPNKEERMFIWNYFIDLIKKKTCSVCGKRERIVISFKDRTFCAECYKNMVFSQKNKEWRELKNDNIQ